MPPVNYLIQKTRHSRPIITHVDKLKEWETNNPPKSWLPNDAGEIVAAGDLGCNAETTDVPDQPDDKQHDSTDGVTSPNDDVLRRQACGDERITTPSGQKLSIGVDESSTVGADPMTCSRPSAGTDVVSRQRRPRKSHHGDEIRPVSSSVDVAHDNNDDTGIAGDASSVIKHRDCPRRTIRKPARYRE